MDNQPSSKTIVKNLKNISFVYDEEKQIFTIIQKDGGETTVVNNIEVVLNKTYAFAFSRFLTRISQRNWYRKLSKN